MASLPAFPPRWPDVLPGLPSGARVAVLRLRSLGDALLGTPALTALARWRPDLRISYLIESQFAPVVAGNPDIADILLVPPGLAARADVARRLRSLRPALVINWHGGSTAAWLTRASGAPLRACFEGTRHAWAHNRLTPPVAPPPERPRLHTVEHQATLLFHLGLPITTLGPCRLIPSRVARQRVRARLNEKGIHGRFAFLNANPRSFTMRWAPSNYHRLLPWLAQECELPAVMARGRVSDVEAVEEQILGDLPPQCGALLTGTSVEDLIALIAESDFVIGSDGGPLHIAAALGKPVVALFSATDSDVWAPWQTPHRIVQNPFPCNPCPADRCYAFAQPECVLSLRVEQVQDAIRDLAAALRTVPGRESG